MAGLQQNLINLLVSDNLTDTQLIYKDDSFIRSSTSVQVDDGITAEILIDSVGGKDAKHFFVSLEYDTDKPFCITVENELQQTNHAGFFIVDDAIQTTLWFPSNPVLRVYDQHRRIVDEEPLKFENMLKQGSRVLKIERPSRGCVEFCVMVFRENYKQFFKEISSPSELEIRPVVKNNWFSFDGIADTWQHLLDGDLYHPMNKIQKRRWPCQLCAHTLFNHLLFLYRQTDKQIYSILCDIAAYSVMLSLPADSRWLHGSLTDTIETHARLQIDGIQMLLTYYEITENTIFLEKALAATDYLITLKDDVQNEDIWFLHDTLETNIEDCRLFYKNLFISRAFGKSESNTLCLNTHIWALIVLYRINKTHPCEKYEQHFQAGLRSLRETLEASPAKLRYKLVYKLRDFFVNQWLKTNKEKHRLRAKKYDDRLRRQILRNLKKKHPRLYMPNGYIERDLCATCLSDIYHLITLKDLLLLYAQTRLDWLEKLVRKSMAYTVKTGIAEYLGQNNKGAAIFLNVLHLYAAVVDDEFAEYTEYFAHLDLPRSVGLETYPFLDL